MNAKTSTRNEKQFSFGMKKHSTQKSDFVEAVKEKVGVQNSEHKFRLENEFSQSSII